MPLTNGIYWQQQSGGLCRMHALNAYFGKETITSNEFNKYQHMYDKEYKTKFNLDAVSCKNFDIVMSDQNNIISFILKHYKVYTRYYALNQIMSCKSTYAELLEQFAKENSTDFFFIYNENHIYGARKKDNAWHSVNSMGGVRLININTVFRSKNLGFIIPVNIKSEFYRNLRIIKQILPNDDIHSIEKFLIKQHTDKKILGDLEIPLGISIDIMEINLTYATDNDSDQFDSIKKIIVLYNEFLCEFTNGGYNNIQLILKFLPDILLKLIKLTVV